MANYSIIHVYRDGDVWVAKRAGASRASAIRNTQKEAYIAAREIALNQGLSITVHGADGRIVKVVYPQESSSSDNCFITTACVTSKNLPDDCNELQTLRKFRDSFVKSLDNGTSLISQYYSIAPRIVNAIDNHKDRKRIYDELFTKIISACNLIKENKNSQAFYLYSNAVKMLAKKYLKRH